MLRQPPIPGRTRSARGAGPGERAGALQVARSRRSPASRERRRIRRPASSPARPPSRAPRVGRGRASTRPSAAGTPRRRRVHRVPSHDPRSAQARRQRPRRALPRPRHGARRDDRRHCAHRLPRRAPGGPLAGPPPTLLDRRPSAPADGGTGPAPRRSAARHPPRVGARRLRSRGSRPHARRAPRRRRGRPPPAAATAASLPAVLCSAPGSGSPDARGGPPRPEPRSRRQGQRRSSRVAAPAVRGDCRAPRRRSGRGREHRSGRGWPARAGRERNPRPALASAAAAGRRNAARQPAREPRTPSRWTRPAAAGPRTSGSGRRRRPATARRPPSTAADAPRRQRTAG